MVRLASLGQDPKPIHPKLYAMAAVDDGRLLATATSILKPFPCQKILKSERYVAKKKTIFAL